MLNYDGATLRALVQLYYDTLSPGITDGTEISKIFAQVTDTTLRTLRDALHDWSSVFMPSKLPNELLALCFVFLPFGDRITVSHVSRSWRAVALSFPAVWSHVDTSYFIVHKNIKLLSAVLLRSGEHPLDVDFWSDYPPTVSTILSALEPHMRRLRSLKWTSRAQADILRSACPLLEFFDCYHPFVITEDFLGGQPGSLRRLHFGTRVQLPRVCPALSTLVELDVSSLGDTEHGAGSFENLFALCPRLESLSLRGLRSADTLPTDPAPTSLRKLHLATSDRRSDLTQYYHAWGAKNQLQSLFLSMRDSAAGRADLGHVFEGAVSLSIHCHPSSSQVFASMATIYQDGRKYGVELQTDGPGMIIPRPMFQLFASHGHTLRDVHTVTVNCHALEMFAPVLGRLRQLRLLVVHITAGVNFEELYTQRTARHTLPLGTLDCLSRLEPARLQDLTLAVEVYCYEKRCQPNAVDAQELLGKLAPLDVGKAAHVRIRGFAGDVVGCLEFAGGRVHFDTESVVERFHFVL